MKKIILSISTFLLFVPIFCAVAFGSENDTVRVGLYFSGSGTNGALVSANLENYKDTGSGYYFGYYDGNRDFVMLGTTSETTISMSQDINLTVNSDGTYSAGVTEGAAMIGCFHLQMDRTYESYELAAAAAVGLKGVYGTAFPVYDNGVFAVRAGSYTSRAEAESALTEYRASATVNSGTAYTVTVTKTGTTEILFEYDGGGSTFLAVEPRPVGTVKPQTWFKGYRYYGGFEYDRSSTLSDGKINVINVVNMEDYAKSVITYEMSPSWPTEALKAQAICARTYALYQHKHDARNFDVCATTNCQVYRGVSAAKDTSDAAVDATAGLALYYGGKVIEADYYSSNGGASENSENVWTTALPYLRGKADPYEATISIPSYSYEKTYTAEELTSLLQKKGYTIGTVASVQASYTDLGNIFSITFTDTAGKSVTVKKEACKLLFSVASMRFTISGEGTSSVVPPAESNTAGEYYVNGQGSKVTGLKGLFTISGNGVVSQYEGESAYVLTSGGKSVLGADENGGASQSGSASVSGNTYVIRGTGSGHNVGMSQYGANAMAKQGLTYEDILHFYYTDVTIESIK